MYQWLIGNMALMKKSALNWAASCPSTDYHLHCIEEVTWNVDVKWVYSEQYYLSSLTTTSNELIKFKWVDQIQLLVYGQLVGMGNLGEVKIYTKQIETDVP